MNTIKLSLLISSFIISVSALATPRTIGAVSLPGLTVNHAPTAGTYTKGTTAFTMALKEFEYGAWNIKCDYTVEETNEAHPPSTDEPFALRITGPYLITNYNADGITASKGKLEMVNYKIGTTGSELVFKNYDATGNFILSNCSATFIY